MDQRHVIILGCIRMDIDAYLIVLSTNYAKELFYGVCGGAYNFATQSF